MKTLYKELSAFNCDILVEEGFPIKVYLRHRRSESIWCYLLYSHDTRLHSISYESVKYLNWQ